jgi:hypothetical protein
MTELKIPEGMTGKDLNELEKASKGLLKNPLTGMRSVVKVLMNIWKRKDDIEATYQTFKPYYNRAGKPFTRKDAERVRSNVLRVSRKMFEFETGKREQKDE